MGLFDFSSLTLIVVLIAINVFTGYTSAQNARASFGESCDRGVRCDSRASLSCVNGTCQCIKEFEMKYDKKQEKCVVLSGERCSYTAIEILTDTTQEKRWTEKLDCVENAECSSDGYCGCTSNFMETSEGLCVPKRLMGENCTADLECRTDKNLVCLEGKCSCNKTESVFEQNYGNCRAKVGYSCENYEGCVTNAYCEYKQRRYYNGDKTWKICKCVNGFKSSKDGLCFGDYGSSCDPITSPCNEEWNCVDGKCRCHFPNLQFYDHNKKECRSYLNGPCLETVNGKLFRYSCDQDNAECRNESGIHRCVCKAGYIGSTGQYQVYFQYSNSLTSVTTKLCKLAHGSSCHTEETCDTTANLICKNGICSCQEFEFYDSKLTKCRGLVGAKCTMDDYCTNGAYCEMYRDGFWKNGICLCAPPAMADSNRRCISPIQPSMNLTKSGVETVDDAKSESEEQEIISV